MIRGARVLVVGLEKSGLASIRLLLAQGAIVTATDAKPLAQLPEAAAELERLHVLFERQSEILNPSPITHNPQPAAFPSPITHNPQSAAFPSPITHHPQPDHEVIVTSPGVPADLPALQAARARGVRVIGEVELAAPFLKGRTIGITGTNGKTTTTTLIGHILRESGIPVQVGGNIGTPVTAMVETSRPEQWNVLELSSFQLETISEFHAEIAVGLNVTQNHLDRHHTFANYAAAKARLFETQRSGAFAILNADDPTCVSYASLTAASPLWFSSTRAVTPGVWLADGEIRFDGEPLMAARDIPIRGRHNIENTMAAAAATRLAGASLESIAAAVRTFQAVEHRLEFVRRLNGVDFYNDSKATSVDATLKALDAFSGGLWVILGGKDKGLDYGVLRAPLAAKAHAALLIGAAAPKIAEQLSGALPLENAGTLENAVRFAFAHAQAGDTILLAPACASFDQFKSFEHRGQVFKNLVQQLEPGN